MESLEFKSSNDKQFINVLKSIGFLEDGGEPTQRYFDFLDQSISKKKVAEGIREEYADLFAVNTSAQSLSVEELKGKFKTLTNGTLSNDVCAQKVSTFVNLR